MENKKQAEAARRAKLLKMRAERLPDIKKQFEENQKRNFNANFAPGGKDEKLVRGKKTTSKKASKASTKPVAKKTTKKSNTKATKTTKAAPTASDKKREVNLLVSTRKGEDTVTVTVADNGPGIPDAEKEHVFNMFYSGSKKVTDSKRSLGLGLALCRSIIRAHGCEIFLEENDPHGASFTFTLPVKEVMLHE